MDLDIKKDLTSNWFKLLQESFCNDISVIENNKTKFKTTTWKRNSNKDEGGGEYKILIGGKIFDKVGVNFSKVYGKFPKEFQTVKTQLDKTFNARIDFSMNDKGKGKITIPFTSEKDLARIVKIIENQK